MLAGRVSSFVNVAGRKVQPDEVERVLREIPGVTDVRVLAAPDAARGEQIAAVVAGHADLTLASIRLHCARRLAPHKIPRIVVRVDAIPLTVRGKTDHRALSELVQQQAGRERVIRRAIIRPPIPVEYRRAAVGSMTGRAPGGEEVGVVGGDGV